MALNFAKGQRVIAFAPATAFPLDARSYFESYDSAVAAAAKAAEPGSNAAKNTEYYFGETLVVNEGGKATLYIIQPDKTLKEVGSVPVGDGKSIEVVNGQIKLKGFGSGYYQYNTNYKPGSTKEDEKDQYVFVEEGFKAGLQPQVVAKASGEGFEIAWYEPNPTTVEGLQAQITALDGSVNNLTNKVDKKADASSLDLYQKQAISSISGYASASTVEGALAEVMSQAMTNAGGITAVEGRVGTAEASIKAMQSALDPVSGKYATKSALNEVSAITINKVDAKLANYYTSAQADAKFETIDNVKTKLANYYTSTQVDGKIDQVVKVAEGKTNSYVLKWHNNPSFESNEDVIQINLKDNPIRDYNGDTIPNTKLKIGDIFYIIETNVPDRWLAGKISEDVYAFAKMETSKVDLKDYATETYVDEAVAGISDRLASYATISYVDGKVEEINGNIQAIEAWAASSISVEDIEKWNKAEENAHNSAVASASAMVAEEAGARESADNALSARIDAEAATRLKDDQALDARISALEEKPFDTYASISYVEDEVSKLDAAIKAETSRATGAEASLATRLELVEDSLGLGGEGDHGGVAEQIATIIGEVWGANASASNLAEASSRIDDHEGRIEVIEDKVKNNLATVTYVQEQIQSAKHVSNVATDDTDFFEITKGQDDVVTINVKDDIESIIAGAVTSVVSGGEYVSATISNHGLTIDDSQLVKAMNGLSNKFLSINTDYIKDISISVSTDSNGRTASMGIIHAGGSTDNINLTEEIFGVSGIVGKAAAIMMSEKVAGNLYAFGNYLGEGLGQNAGILLTHLGVKGHPSELASGIIAAADYIHTLGTKYDAGNVIKAVDWVSSNKDVVSNLASNAITSVQTSTLVVSHSGNNLMIDLPSVIWLDGGTASDTYGAEEAVYNELLNNEYGN